MPSTGNLAIVAAAGSGKTHELIRRASANPDQRILITTYTTENLRQIEDRLQRQPGGRPANITTLTLFEFLLRECVKPFQAALTAEPNYIRSVYYEKRPVEANYGGIEDFKRYFLTSSRDVYSDYVSQAAVEINSAVKGEVIKRLELLWSEIYIDEAQDMNGYDLELMDLILASRIRLVLVCDPRQAVLRANNHSKHRRYTGSKFVNWIDERTSLQRQDMTTCRRAVQSICDFADGLFPSMPKTQSLKKMPTGKHAGVYLVRKSDIDEYRRSYQPQELRWDRNNKDAGTNALNMRGTKGLEFRDVLIHPSGTMMKHLENGAELAESSVAALYVAITRAEYSVGIVTEKKTTKTGLQFWAPKKDELDGIFDFSDG